MAKRLVPGGPKNLSDPENANIRRMLLRFRSDPIFHGTDQRVPLVQFAVMCGVTRQTLYSLTKQTSDFVLMPKTRERLLAGIRMVTEQGVRWRRRGGTWQPFYPDGTPVLAVNPERPKDDRPHV